MPNQFTKADELGLPRPQGKGPTHPLKKEHKDKIAASQIRNRLLKYAKAKGKQVSKYRMEPAQVTAAKVLLDRWMPTLASIQQTTKEEPANPQELEAQLHALLANPAARHEILRALGQLPDAANTPSRDAAMGEVPRIHNQDAA